MEMNNLVVENAHKLHGIIYTMRPKHIMIWRRTKAHVDFFVWLPCMYRSSVRLISRIRISTGNTEGFPLIFSFISWFPVLLRI